jgi:aromatic-L-amino-acid decarboxylase
MTGVNRRGHIYMTGTTLPQGFVMRFCVLSFRTHQDRMTMALEDLAAEIAAQVPV